MVGARTADLRPGDPFFSQNQIENPGGTAQIPGLRLDPTVPADPIVPEDEARQSGTPGQPPLAGAPPQDSGNPLIGADRGIGDFMRRQFPPQPSGPLGGSGVGDFMNAPFKLFQPQPGQPPAGQGGFDRTVGISPREQPGSPFGGMPSGGQGAGRSLPAGGK